MPLPRAVGGAGDGQSGEYKLNVDALLRAHDGQGRGAQPDTSLAAHEADESVLELLSQEDFAQPSLAAALVARATLLRDALLSERAQRRALESDLRTLSSYSAGLRDNAERARGVAEPLRRRRGRVDVL